VRPFVTVSRLSIAVDTLAITSLHSNNADVLRGAINRYFGEGPVADKAEAKRAQKA
jgi:hypothetical protein